MKTLLIDNYDSFTYNLFQLLAEANGEEPIVVRNDEATWDELSCLDFDNVVISPGPGRPDRQADFGICAEAIRCSAAPLLGVCLGHQGLGSAHGAVVAAAPRPLHGRLSTVVHDGSPLFAGIPGEFRAVRYHSLRVAEPLPRDLRPIARARDGVLMAVAHRSRPLWGVQFHPESICTEHGRRLLANFRDLSSDALSGRAASSGGATEPPATPTGDRRSRPVRVSSGARQPRLRVKRLDLLVDPERAFVHLYGTSPNAFWLDSSRLDQGARFSFVGDDSGPLGATITYDVSGAAVRVKRGDRIETHRESIFDYLGKEMRRLVDPASPLPFDFNCGFAGWLGYELKADCGAAAAHESGSSDAAFVFADRMIAFDHAARHTYLLCLVEPEAGAGAERWIAGTEERLRALPPVGKPVPTAGDREPVSFSLGRSRERYLDDVAECKRRLAAGESYEICLTNKLSTDVSPEPLSLYRTLRRVNPAPFSAFVRIDGTAVLSSSPERLLAIGRDRWVEAKPIKGTCRRGESPAEDARLAERLRGDEKNRAENLMVVDLLRNDLGSVCEVGTVSVPHLMEVESYATVHQLVSTVRGRLREDLQAPDCIRACFPPGSMTGAPKLRTMRIIDELEGEGRGVYSGAIGYLGLGGGCDLSVVIRTIVLDGRSATIGSGGAIVAQSEAEDEYEEMLLKAGAPMQAIHAQSGLIGDPRLAVRPTLEYLPAKSLGTGER